ncbi:MAG TPA: PepSY-associated TM helix domain-containing protein [Rhizomicrobium sp.]|nr:PepSY-associated TM helix domain-containing protein [Rhizomicrobium sp.]
MLRGILVRLHRYAGLTLAAFLIVAGVTGSIIAFNEELDAALNPELFTATARGPALAPSELARRVERQLRNASVTLIPLSVPMGEAAVLRVEPKTGTLAYDQVFADPVSGQVLGTRDWGAARLTRANAIPFIYLLHYTLQLPGVWGILLMGVMGCLWAIDCFIGFALTLPRGKPFWTKWRTSWRVKRAAGTYRLNLDLHRAGGLWLWGLLLMMAVSGVAMNLPEQVFRPVLSLVATLSPSPIEIAAKRPAPKPGAATIGYDEAVERARTIVQSRGSTFTPRNVFHYAAFGAYGVGFSRAGEDGETGLGSSFLYIDDRSGVAVAREIMGEGTAGDIFAQAQFPLHSGRIFGLPGRIAVCLLGLAVAGLSGTGVYIWARKRRHKVRKAKTIAASVAPAALLEAAE